MLIMGIGGERHDANVAILRDGAVLGCYEEERFTRIKRQKGFPFRAMEYALKKEGLRLPDIDCFAYNSANTFVDFDRNKNGVFPQEITRRIDRELCQPFLDLGRESGGEIPWEQSCYKIGEGLYLVNHSIAHAASAYYVSPFDRALTIVVEGGGDGNAGGIFLAEGLRINLLEYFDYSLGYVWEGVTEYLGFRPNFDEGKVMGLAGYGRPSFLNLIMKYIFDYSKKAGTLTREGAFAIDRETAMKVIADASFPGRRKYEDAILEEHKDLAKTIQEMTELLMRDVVLSKIKETGCRSLCLAGGVALNSVMNGNLLRETPVQEIFVQPASNDGGTGLGAALYVCHAVFGEKERAVMDHAYLGAEFSKEEILADMEEVRRNHPIQFHFSTEGEGIFRRTADLLAREFIIGWFQGRAEFGPRALGNRSILADPRNVRMKDILNAKVKFREPFRPFAPSILEEKCGEYFSSNYPSPFMLLVYDVLEEKRSAVPAINHVDNTARVQTVNRRQNPGYYRLIQEFEALTGVPVVLNTSFNIKGEPIVNSPKDALLCFLGTQIDFLVLGDILVSKGREGQF